MDIDLIAPGLERLFDQHPPLDRIAYGMTFAEGPVWDRRGAQLYWVEIIGNAIWKWKPGVGRELVLKPSGHANGMTFDRRGRLVVAGWSNRTVWCFEKDGSIATLASRYDGRKLNSPNDVVVRSDGSVYWTDSAGGLIIPGMVAEDTQRYLDVQGVYRLSPDGKEVSLVIDDCTYPNGLTFSPDEKLLYVNDSRLGLIRVFDVRSDGSVGAGRLFHKMTGAEAGVADGMKVDVEGNVYCTGPGGVHVIDPGGRLLGRLRIPGHGTNMAWGDDDGCSLYVTTYNSVYRTRAKIPGVAVW
ncbi:MAG: SMP-30/gluconolactonase/LRE family protein [Betaproteobacteria bacterium]|nr:SMP-30/gluconolactonase/LRE family protein [Betaproteobacteria bacterium]